MKNSTLKSIMNLATEALPVPNSDSRTINILNVEIDNLSLQELLEKLKNGGVVYTPNVDHFSK